MYTGRYNLFLLGREYDYLMLSKFEVWFVAVYVLELMKRKIDMHKSRQRGRLSFMLLGNNNYILLRLTNR